MNLSPFQIFFLLTVVKIVIVLVITLTSVAYTVLLERKVAGRMQNRWGPSRVGPFGLLQPLADGIKLFLKEDLMPIAIQKPLFVIAPIIALSCALISISVVPFGPMTKVQGVDLFDISNINIGLLVILGITSIGVYGIALSGWSVEQQVRPAGQPARHLADDQLRTRTWPFAGWRRPAGRFAEPADHRR